MAERFLKRWSIYQKERFPVLAHGILIAAFSFSAVGFSALLRGAESLPSWKVIFIAFANSFFAFLHLRIADEFKDFEEDSKYRPYRAVPRGLVKLRELGWLWVITGVAQLFMAIWLDARLVWLLAVIWLYLALMSREFFFREWLKQRPITYLWTHMLIMPLIDLYATACDWLPIAGKPPQGLFWFVIVSFFNGIVIEIGRKVRAPENEEHGVQTYSALWGARTAAVAWLTVMAVTAGSAIYAAGLIQFRAPVAIALCVLLGAATIVVVSFSKTRSAGVARWFERLSGLWTILLYLMLGAVPLLLRVLKNS